MSELFAQRNIAVVKGFAKRLNELLDSFGYPRYYSGRYTQLAEKYGVSAQTTKKWCQGQGVPSPAVLLAMAQDFDTSVDALLSDRGLVHARPMPVLESSPIYELTGTSGGTQHIDFAQTDVVITSALPFITEQQTGMMALVVNWADLETPELRTGDVLFVSMDCRAIVEGGTYVVRTPSMTTVRVGSVSLSDNIRFSKVDRSGVEEHTDVPMRRLSFNTDADFRAPPPEAPGSVLIVGRVLGIHRDFQRIPSRARRKKA